MAAFRKFNQFVEDLAHKVHDLSADTIKVALTNTAPVATDAVFADLVEIASGNGYTAGGEPAVLASSGQASGTYRLKLDDLVITATGGPVGPFRYCVLYNADAAGGPLIGYYDYGQTVTLQAGEPLTIDFDGSNGVLSLA